MRCRSVYFVLKCAFVILCICYGSFKWHTLITSNGLLYLATQPEKQPLVEQENILKHLQDKSAGLSLEHEVTRRKDKRTPMECWLFLNRELNQLKSQTNGKTSLNAIHQLLAKCNDYQAMMLYDFDKLSNGVDKLPDWRLQESLKFGNLVQRRLDYLQNPTDCGSANILLCSHPTSCGYACQLHHRTFCLIMAYATNRTLVLKEPTWTHLQKNDMTDQNTTDPFFKPLSTCTRYNETGMDQWTADGKHDQVQTMTISAMVKPRPVFLPPAVPEDLADGLVRFHDNPSVWWIGQFVKYLTRPRENLKRFYVNKKQSSGFELPIVGVHIRRTDKNAEAKYHNVEKYMLYVEEWFNMFETRHPGTKRRVYLASDEPGVLTEVQTKVIMYVLYTDGDVYALYIRVKGRYSNYIFINDTEVAESAKTPEKRNTETSLRGILQDIHLLSLCNYVVCTFSSNVCRAVYETMQTMHGDASQYVKSLDVMYFFWGQTTHIVEAVEVQANKPENNIIELLPGDRISIGENNWNGYSIGKNLRTGKQGLFPSYKTVDTVVRLKMPTYPEVKEIP